MHASNSSLRSFGSFSFESYAGFMRRNSFFLPFGRLRFLKHMHASNSSLRSFGSFSFESYAGFMRRNSFFLPFGKALSDLRQKNSDNRLIVKPAFRFTKNGASSMAFVLNRAYEKATWGLKEDDLGSFTDYAAKKLRQPPNLLNLRFDSRKTERPPWLSF